MADNQVIQAQGLVPPFPIRILDRFLGLLLGGIRGTGLLLSIFVVRCFNVLSLLPLISIALSALYQHLKKHHWSKASSILITGLAFIPVLVGMSVFGVGAFAYTAFQMLYLLSATTLQGWLNRSYKEIESFQEDLGKITRFVQRGGRGFYLYYRHWPEVFKHILRQAPPLTHTEAYYNEEMLYWVYLNELRQTLPYTSQRERLFFSMKMTKAVLAHHRFPVQRVCEELQQSQSDEYLDVAPLEIQELLNAAFSALSYFPSRQEEIYESSRNRFSNELNLEWVNLEQTFGEVKELMDACMGAWAQFKFVQDQIDNSASVDDRFAEDREKTKAILAVECDRLKSKIQIPFISIPIDPTQILQDMEEEIRLLRDAVRRAVEAAAIRTSFEYLASHAPQINPAFMDEEAFAEMALTDEELENIKHTPLTETQKSQYVACEDAEIKRLLSLYKDESARLLERCCISWETEFSPENKKMVLIKQYFKKEILPNGQERERWLPVLGKSTIFKENELRTLCRGDVSERDFIPHPITRDPISHVGDIKPAMVTQEGKDFPPNAREEDIEQGCITRYRYHPYQDSDPTTEYVYSHELTHLAAQLQEAYRIVLKNAKSAPSTSRILTQLNPATSNQRVYRPEVNTEFLMRLEQRQYPSPLAVPPSSSDECKENKILQPNS